MHGAANQQITVRPYGNKQEGNVAFVRKEQEEEPRQGQ